MRTVIALLPALVIGMLLPVQAAANSRLGALSGHAGWGAILSLVIGTTAVGIYLIAAKAPLLQVQTLGAADRWIWLGGLIGASFIVAGIILVPRVGVSAFLIAVIAGQIFSATVIDRLGLLGLEPKMLGPLRMTGLILIVVGAAATYWPQPSAPHRVDRQTTAPPS